jgi:hypothetical protein
MRLKAVSSARSMSSGSLMAVSVSAWGICEDIEAIN